MTIFSFDNNPRFYFLAANLLLLLIALIAFSGYLKPKFVNKKWLIPLFVFLNLLVMVLMRLPFIVFNQDVHPDESEMTAGAMALGRNMKFWGQVDGMTSGFFNFYPLVFFCKIFKQPFDYTSARIVGAILLSGSLIFFFSTVKTLFSVKSAFVSLFFITSFLGKTNSIELLHYGSEYTSVLLINVLCWQFSRIYSAEKPSDLLLFLHGFVAPITIFAKLQATPIAFCCVLSSMLFLFFKHFKQSPKLVFKYIAVICLGCVCYILVTFALTIRHQIFDDMISLYFVNNLGYGLAGKVAFFDFNFFYRSFFEKANYILVLKGLALFFVLFCILELSVRTVSKRQNYSNNLKIWPITFVMLLVVFSIFSVFKTGFLFGHYLNFLIFPAGFVFVLFLSSLEKNVSAKANKVALAGLVTVNLVSNCHYPFTNSYISTPETLRPLYLSKTSAKILKYTKPNEPLAVWGNGSRFHLETKLVQATRWNFTLFEPYSAVQKDFLHQEYLKDMKQSKVPVFVDSYITQERACHGHEVVPTIGKYIKENYVKVADIDQNRIYVRNDRYQSLNESDAR